MLADILKMIYALPTKEQMENMTSTECEELIKKFDDDEPAKPEE